MFDQICTNYRFLLNEALFMAPMSYNPSLALKLECLVTAIVKRNEVAAYIRGDI